MRVVCGCFGVCALVLKDFICTEWSGRKHTSACVCLCVNSVISMYQCVCVCELLIFSVCAVHLHKRE